MKCYLSAVRGLQVECGEGDPRVESMSLLELILQGVKREQARVLKRTRLPLTPANPGEARQGVEPGLIESKPHHAVGRMLHWIFGGF